MYCCAGSELGSCAAPTRRPHTHTNHTHPAGGRALHPWGRNGRPCASCQRAARYDTTKGEAERVSDSVLLRDADTGIPYCTGVCVDILQTMALPTYHWEMRYFRFLIAFLRDDGAEGGPHTLPTHLAISSAQKELYLRCRLSVLGFHLEQQCCVLLRLLVCGTKDRLHALHRLGQRIKAARLRL